MLFASLLLVPLAAAQAAAPVATVATNTTYFKFPTAKDWWVKGAVNGVDFEKIAGSSDLFLGNDEGRISTTYAYTLAHNIHPSNHTLRLDAPLNAVAPGTGYYVYLTAPGNGAVTYARSEKFEIKAAGAAQTVPPSLLAPTQNPSSAVPSAVATPSATPPASGATAAAAGSLALAVAGLAAVLLA